VAVQGGDHPGVIWLNGFVADNNGSAPGAILVTIGVVMFAFVLIANALALPTNPVLRLLQEFIFVPIILIFAGRAMQRRAKRGTAPEPAPVRTPTTQQQRSTQRRAQQQAGPVPERRPRTEPDLTLEEILRGESDVVPIPPPKSPARPRGARTGSAVDRSHEAIQPKSSQSYRDSFQPKTSAEMIAEAKRRLRRET
jgi:hypothetical protein